MADTTDDLANLRNRFHALMVDTIHRCITEIKYRPSYVIAHMADHDGVDTAIWLVSIENDSSGFARLYDERRLDLSAEALILRPEFAPLFPVELRRRAWDTLELYGYEFPSCVNRL